MLWFLLLQPIWHRLVVTEEVMMADTIDKGLVSMKKHMQEEGQNLKRILENGQAANAKR
jgi:hypothetical protein